MSALSIEVVTADRVLWSGSASGVSVPAADGDLGILPSHSPVLAVLRPGVVRITGDSGEKVNFDVLGGFVSVDDDAVTVVIESEQIEIDGVAPAPSVVAGARAPRED